jgi:hypothetical protein
VTVVALDRDTQARISAHLGYSRLAQGGVLAFGGIVPTQYHFLLDFNQNNLQTEDLPRVLRILCNLDEIECLLMDAAKQSLVTATAGGTQLNEKAADRLEREYTRWALRLADMFAVPVNPGAQRFVGSYGGANIPVGR